jgi:hypothetical protein
MRLNSKQPPATFSDDKDSKSAYPASLFGNLLTTDTIYGHRNITSGSIQWPLSVSSIKQQLDQISRCRTLSRKAQLNPYLKRQQSYKEAVQLYEFGG